MTLPALAGGVIVGVRVVLLWLAILLRGAAEGCDAASTWLDQVRQRLRGRA